MQNLRGCYFTAILGGTAGILFPSRKNYFSGTGFVFLLLIINFTFINYLKRGFTMEYVCGKLDSRRVEISDVVEGKVFEEPIQMHGAIHSIRDMSGFSFIILRKKDGVVQCIYNNDFDSDGIVEECTVLVTGVAHPDDRAPNGFELTLSDIKVLSRPAEAMPVPISKWKMNLNLDTALNLRPITLRNLRERSIFKVQEGIARGFRDFLFSQGFTEIRTPKIVYAGAEGGSNLFKLDYFGRKAFLAQSPQFHKQTMVGIYERVFEAAPVFRAEKHSTTRHINEYTSLDFEMGYIDSFTDIMNMETAMLKYTFNLLKTEYAADLKRLDVKLPEFDKIPSARFTEAKELAAKKYNRQIRDPYDLEPEEEQNIGRYFKEECGSDFVFITHYPEKKRPFYAMNDPEDPKYTLSFDLLFRGMEITTGGQRIHDYQQQVDKMIARGMNPDDFKSYLMIHKHGMPPHGGLGIGLERLTMKLLDQNNVRNATLFPRDLNRLEP